MSSMKCPVRDIDQFLHNFLENSFILKGLPQENRKRVMKAYACITGGHVSLKKMHEMMFQGTEPPPEFVYHSQMQKQITYGEDVKGSHVALVDFTTEETDSEISKRMLAKLTIPHMRDHILSPKKQLEHLQDTIVDLENIDEFNITRMVHELMQESLSEHSKKLQQQVTDHTSKIYNNLSPFVPSTVLNYVKASVDSYIPTLVQNGETIYNDFVRDGVLPFEITNNLIKKVKDEKTKLLSVLRSFQSQQREHLQTDYELLSNSWDSFFKALVNYARWYAYLNWYYVGAIVTTIGVFIKLPSTSTTETQNTKTRRKSISSMERKEKSERKS